MPPIPRSRTAAGIGLAACALAVSTVSTVSAVAPLGAQEAHAVVHTGQARPPASGAVTPLRGLGTHHRDVRTASPAAQLYFDQGLRLAYAFNHPEALRSFQEAARIDPRCAMCEWGVAYVLGPNVNAPMEPAAYPDAHAAAGRALALARPGTREHALATAMATRYAPAAPTNRAPLDSTYAAAMTRVAERWPDDADIATLRAESLMLLSPWTYWSRDGQPRDTQARGWRPRPGTTSLLGSLERALRADSAHPGACHYYIHAVEAAFPARALPCAERLAALMPGAGHIVHMPGHIYLRVGRYDDAIAANRHALHADEAYLADRGPGGVYAATYYPHNSHFLGFAATMAGRADDAIQAARDAAVRTPPELAEAAPELQLLVAYPHLTLATFGRWEAAKREPLPPAPLRVAGALAWFARGVALARTGATAEAATALDTVRAAAAGESRYPVAPVLKIAQRVLDAELATARGDHATAVARLTEAMTIEDGLSYMEPPYWHQPVRQPLGNALLASGRPREAAQRFREDLERFPNNVWSREGLAQASTRLR